MTTIKGVKISLRLDDDVHSAILILAQKNGYETNAYIERLIKIHAMEFGDIAPIRLKQLRLVEEILAEAVKFARLVDIEGGFDKDFTLHVIERLVKNETFRAKYEEAIGGNAYKKGLPGKSPLNMYLGWYIKNAIGAEPILDENNKPKRVQVREQPIQSYTLLKKPNEIPRGTPQP